MMGLLTFCVVAFYQHDNPRRWKTAWKSGIVVYLFVDFPRWVLDLIELLGTLAV